MTDTKFDTIGEQKSYIERLIAERNAARDDMQRLLRERNAAEAELDTLSGALVEMREYINRNDQLTASERWLLSTIEAALPNDNSRHDSD